MHWCIINFTLIIFLVFRNDFGPGPAHGLDPSMTRNGKDGTPHYSLGSRHKELEPFKTPGPAAYGPEQHDNPYSIRQPAYSMGTRTRYRKRQFSILNTNNNFICLISYNYTGDANPSPNSYTLPTLLGEKIPNRTSSACYSMPGRRSIGGFDTDYAKTPGPARYGTTSAEVTQRKAPNYSMQSRNYMPTGIFLNDEPINTLLFKIYQSNNYCMR